MLSSKLIRRRKGRESAREPASFVAGGSGSLGLVVVVPATILIICSASYSRTANDPHTHPNGRQHYRSHISASIVAPPTPKKLVWNSNPLRPAPKFLVRSPFLQRNWEGRAGKGFGPDSEASSVGGKTARKIERRRKAERPEVLRDAKQKAEDIVRRIEQDRRGGETDFFWKIIPALLDTEFKREEISRVHDFIEISAGQQHLPEDIIRDERRPTENLHAFLPGVDAPGPFRNLEDFDFVGKLRENFSEIKKEFHALVEANVTQARFRSVTTLNYKNGWKTLPLYYNGQKIPGFPYHLCPVTTAILSDLPVAGRIAGFNRQSPGSGIPRHTDGNNMWLTCQMGISIPSNGDAWIEVAGEKFVYKEAEPVIYDTTFPHETFNEAAEEERVVLHIDFWNYPALSNQELKALQKVYEYRQKYLEAEGVPQTL